MSERAVCGLLYAILYVVLSVIVGVSDLEILSFGACGCVGLTFALVRGDE